MTQYPEGCTANIGDGKSPPFVCGRPAQGPHPNPELGYRFPLCATHRADAQAEWDAATFYEEDEPLAYIQAAFERGPHGVTAPPRTKDTSAFWCEEHDVHPSECGWHGA